MKNKLARRVALLMAVAAMSVSAVACGGSSEAATQEEAALTEEEYEAKAAELSESITSAMSGASSIDANDTEAAKELLESLKDPFVEFASVKAPDTYADAHEKFKSGCDGMVEYLDMMVTAIDSGELDAEKMTSLVTAIQTDFQDGAAMLQ